MLRIPYSVKKPIVYLICGEVPATNHIPNHFKKSCLEDIFCKIHISVILSPPQPLYEAKIMSITSDSNYYLPSVCLTS